MKNKKNESSVSGTNLEIAVTLALTKRLFPTNLDVEEIEEIQKDILQGDYIDRKIARIYELNTVNDTKPIDLIFALNYYVIGFACDFKYKIYDSSTVELPAFFREPIGNQEYFDFMGANNNQEFEVALSEMYVVVKLAHETAVQILNEKGIGNKIREIYKFLANPLKNNCHNYDEIKKILNTIQFKKEQKHANLTIL